MTVYHILGAVAALLLGVWLGMPGKHGSRWRDGGSARSTQGPRNGERTASAHDPRHLAELEGALARRAESKSAKRHFTLFGGLISPKQRASARRRGGRVRFRTSAPEPVDRDKHDADEEA